MSPVGPPFGPPVDCGGLPFDPTLPPLPPGGAPLPPEYPPNSGAAAVARDHRKEAEEQSLHGRMSVVEDGLVLDIKRYILLELGYPNIEVELCDEQLERAISDTIEDFMRFNVLDLMMFWKIPLQNAVAEYALPLNLRVVRDVTTFKLSQFDVIFGADMIVNPIYLRNTRDAYQDILTYWLSEASFETMKRTYGLETSWDIIQGRTRIRVYPTPSSDRVMVIKGTYYPKPGEITDQTLGTKSELFRRCALARAMMILGRIRGKRTSGIQTSQGVVMLDGEQLRQEGKTMLDESRVELQATGRPAGFYRG